VTDDNNHARCIRKYFILKFLTAKYIRRLLYVRNFLINFTDNVRKIVIILYEKKTISRLTVIYKFITLNRRDAEYNEITVKYLINK
jgi:hypothetical protein